ncbi:helix-turn-helix domain-containing protein [Streptomyces sp. NPDC047972]|uniref:helix-turn-helix domain-containing protein n=1 Tax=Streptomyces sp. NPDC047972 TaxID=3365493 RepID=UPI003715B8CB
MEQNWNLVAEALRASRLLHGWTQEELAQQAGTSRVTIQTLEYATPRKRISRSLRDVTAALGWDPRHVDDLLAGAATGPPMTRQSSPAPEPQPDLPLAVAHELGLGDLIDSKVIPLGESDARVIIVVRAAEGTTPEQTSRALDEWRRLQTQLSRTGPE